MSGSEASAPPVTNSWERPWSVEEMKKNCGNWTLAGDAGLLLHLQDFAQRLLAKTHDIEKSVHELSRESRATDCRLHNTMNDFLMTANNQFVENRVYEDVADDASASDALSPKAVEPQEVSEAELVPKVAAAVAQGLKIMQLHTKPSVDDGNDPPMDVKVHIGRPLRLPVLIGSAKFYDDASVGTSKREKKTTEDIVADISIGQNPTTDITSDIMTEETPGLGLVEDDDNDEDEMFAAPIPAPNQIDSNQSAPPARRKTLTFIEDEEEEEEGGLFDNQRASVSATDPFVVIPVSDKTKERKQTLISIFGPDEDAVKESLFEDDDDEEEEVTEPKEKEPPVPTAAQSSIESSGDFDGTSVLEETPVSPKLDFAAELALKLGVGPRQSSLKNTTVDESGKKDSLKKIVLEGSEVTINELPENKKSEVEAAVVKQTKTPQLSNIFSSGDSEEDEDDFFSPRAVAPTKSYAFKNELTEDRSLEPNNSLVVPKPLSLSTDNLFDEVLTKDEVPNHVAVPTRKAPQPPTLPPVTLSGGLFDEEDEDDFFAVAPKVSQPTKHCESKNVFSEDSIDSKGEKSQSSLTKAFTDKPIEVEGNLAVADQLTGLFSESPNKTSSWSRDEDLFSGKPKSNEPVIVASVAVENETSTISKKKMLPGAVSLFGPNAEISKAIKKQRKDTEESKDSAGWSSDEDMFGSKPVNKIETPPLLAKGVKKSVEKTSVVGVDNLFGSESKVEKDITGWSSDEDMFVAKSVSDKNPVAPNKEIDSEKEIPIGASTLHGPMNKGSKDQKKPFELVQ